MRVFIISLLLALIAFPVIIQAYNWPIEQQNVQHRLISVMGECRDRRVAGVIVDSIHHFHRGVDINAPCSTRVYTIEGDTCYADRIGAAFGSGINIGHFRYYHLAGYRYNDSIMINAGTFFAKTDGDNHVHLQESNIVLKHPGDLNDVRWINPLRAGGLSPFVDSTSPQIRYGASSIKFWRQGTNDTIGRDTMSGRIDISVDAFDQQTDSLGHGLGGNMGIYRCYGYVFKDGDTLRKDTLSIFEYQRYDTCPNTNMVHYAYAPGSYNSRHIYFITNNPFDTLNPSDYFWNSKQKTGQPASVDAESIEVAKFKDGYYWTKASAYDIRGNSDAESVKVHVDNFNPKVKSAFPADWASFVPTKHKTLYCTFSEAMDTTTIKTDNIKVLSLRDTTRDYTIDTLRYLKDSLKLYLKVNSGFDFNDTVQVRLLKGVHDLAGKSIGDAKGDTVAYAWTFVAGLLQITDNDSNDVEPDVWHGRMV